MCRLAVYSVLPLALCAVVLADPPFAPDRPVRLPAVDPLEGVVRLPPVDDSTPWTERNLRPAMGGGFQQGSEVTWAFAGQPLGEQTPASEVRPVLAEEIWSQAPIEVAPTCVPERGFHGLLEDLLHDQCNYYSWPSVLGLAAGFGVGAVMANTSIDESLRREYQERLRSARTDEYWEAFHAPKFLGDGTYTMPVYGAAMLLECFSDEGSLAYGVGKWGERSLRTILVGGPPMLLMQRVTGAGRPGESPDGSHWTPFQDNNGVSGHAFMGAIPFLSAAKMVESPLWKAAFYAGSVFPGFSRVNDDNHYASQVILGWWMAYLAATAVDRTEMNRKLIQFGPMPMADGVGVGLEIRR